MPLSSLPLRLCLALALLRRSSTAVDVDVNGEPALGVRAAPVLHLQVLPQSGAITASLAHDPASCIEPAPFGDVCAVHKWDALATCVALEGCAALTCLPEANYGHPFAHLPLIRHRTASGELIGDDAASQELRAAAAAGDLRKMKQAIEGGAVLDSVDGTYGRTALIEAARRAHVPAVTQLLAAGANVQVQDFAGLTPIMHVRSAAGVASTASPHVHETAASFDRTLELLRRRVRETEIEYGRLNEGEMRSDAESDAAVRASFTGADVDYAATALLSAGLRGPPCIAKSDRVVDAPSDPSCARNAAVPVPGPHCENLVLVPQALGDVVDMATLDRATMRQITYAVREQRTIVVAPSAARLTALWFRNLADAPIGYGRGHAHEEVAVLFFD